MEKVSRGLVNLMLMRAETIYHGQSLFKYSYSKNRPKTICPCLRWAGDEIEGAGVYGHSFN